jgi:MshEN domain
MDERVEALRRLHEADPDDVDLARRVDRAQVRAGRPRDLERRYGAKFLCPLSFESLETTDEPWRRFCQQCQRHVRLVKTAEQLTEGVAQGACVAYPRRALLPGGALFGLVKDPRLHAAREPASACVVSSDLEWVDLGNVELDPATLTLIPPFMARSYLAVPLAQTDAVVYFGVSARACGVRGRSLEDLTDELRRFLERDVVLALADHAELLRVIYGNYPLPEFDLLAEEGMTMGIFYDSDPQETC